MYDFNILEEIAVELINNGKYIDARNIYLFMADGDNSLDGGHLGERIGFCYEMMGDKHAAKYWYGRAVEENPGIDVYVERSRRYEGLNIDYLVHRDT